MDRRQPGQHRPDAIRRRALHRRAAAARCAWVTISEFMDLRESQIAMPPDMALLFKALVTADRVLLQLDPDFDVIRTAAPLVREQMRARYTPRRLLREQRAASRQMYEMAADVPKTLRLLMYRLKQGRLGVDMEVRHLHRLSTALERAATRLSLAVVAGAFILGIGPTLLASQVHLFFRHSRVSGARRPGGR